MILRRPAEDRGRVRWRIAVKVWPIVLVVAASLAVCAMLAARAIAPAGPMLWDESFHSLWALRLAADLRAFDVIGLAYDSYRQVYWPPLFSWYAGLLIALFGPSTALMRATGLIALAACALVISFAGRQIAPKGGKTAAGLAAAFAFMLSGGVIALAPQAMLELPGLLLMAIGYWQTFRVLSAASVRLPEYAALGVVIVLSFLAKQNYGVLLALGIAGTFLIDGQWWNLHPGTEIAARRKGQLVAAGVLAVLLAGWFAYPPKLIQTLQSLRNTPWGPDAGSLEGILFYPRALLWLAGSWLMLALWAVVLALSLQPRCWRDARLRLLLIVIVLQAIFAQLSATKIDRHILPLVLPLALLAGYWAAELWNRLEVARRKPAMFAAGVLALVVIQIGLALPGVQPVTPAAGEDVLAAVHDALKDGPALVIGSIDLPLAPAMHDWQMVVDGQMAADGAGALVYASEQRFAANTLAKLPSAAEPPLRRLVERWPAATGSYSLYIGLPLDAPELEVRETTLPAVVTTALARRPVQRIILVLPDSSPRYPAVTPASVTAQLAALGFAPVAGQTRQIGGVTVTVLAKTGAGSSG